MLGCVPSGAAAKGGAPRPATCLAPMTTQQSFEIRDLVVYPPPANPDHQLQQMFVEACVATNLAGVSDLEVSFVAYSTAGEQLGAEGKPAANPAATHNSPPGAPRFVMPVGGAPHIGSEGIGNVRRDLMASVRWIGADGQRRVENYFIAFRFSPAARRP